MLFLFGFLQFGNPILLRAAQYNRDAVIILLLDAGADINATNIDDFTALMWASLHGAEAAARFTLLAVVVHRRDRAARKQREDDAE